MSANERLIDAMHRMSILSHPLLASSLDGPLGDMRCDELIVALRYSDRWGKSTAQASADVQT